MTGAERIARLEQQVSLLMTIALTKGDATVNQARAAAGLPTFDAPLANSAHRDRAGGHVSGKPYTSLPKVTDRPGAGASGE
jgi:hypothetical protein